ncbi:hypothetical protein Tco_1326615 [Tanacetum coccineum]
MPKQSTQTLVRKIGRSRTSLGMNYATRVPMKREVSGILSSLSKTILVTPTIHHGEVTQTLGGDNPKILKIIFQTHITDSIGTTFEARIRDYMAAHSKRMERFKNAIFKQRKEINGRMTKMFRLLKELTTSRAPEKVLIREEAQIPITENVNSISLARGEEERNDKMDETLDNTEKPTAVRKEVEEVLSSRPIEYYLKHRINEKLIEGLVDNNRFNDSLSRARVGKGGFKHVNTLVDQESDVNVMPYSTYVKLTDERHAEIDIRLSLASHSYIYPLGIAEDVLVEVAEHVYPFDKGTITLRSGKSKASPGIGRKDKASLGKGDEVQPMKEK